MVFLRLVLRFDVACDGDLARAALTFWIKSRSDAGFGTSPRERREEGQERMVETYQLPKGIHVLIECRAIRRHGRHADSSVIWGNVKVFALGSLS